MSIDYDELREWLSTVERENHGRDGVMEFTHPGNTVEIIRELLRLRDGVERAVSTAKRQIVLTINAGHVEENGPTCPALADLTDLTSALTDLLNGDTE